MPNKSTRSPAPSKDRDTAKTELDEWKKESDLRNRMWEAQKREWLKDPGVRDFLKRMPPEFADDPEMAEQHRKDIREMFGIVVD